ncbi:hypothetical protein [Desulfoferrobacter suflitae]|uniref:hypothetical protein n=1 Tax=Desulfoferrobacter suflitae TaxID=2865782 RepID=UPI002164E26A|nr:hypothetical protein [Desulfoferrobacter suflitae]MCK8601859.1 hypothetical protein [Desulfoferrobacter suflitae]
MVRPRKASFHSRLNSANDGAKAGFIPAVGMREVLPEIVRMMIIYTLMENEGRPDKVYRKSLKRLCFLTGLRLEEVTEIVSDLMACCVVERLEDGAHLLMGSGCLKEAMEAAET